MSLKNTSNKYWLSRFVTFMMIGNFFSLFKFEALKWKDQDHLIQFHRLQARASFESILLFLNNIILFWPIWLETDIQLFTNIYKTLRGAYLRALDDWLSTELFQMQLKRSNVVDKNVVAYKYLFIYIYILKWLITNCSILMWLKYGMVLLK